MPTTGYLEPPTSHAPQQEGLTGGLRHRHRTAAARATAEDRAHIVRVIAAHPTYTQWLRDQVATVLDREATRLTEHGHPTQAALLHDRATGYRRGDLAVW